MREQDQAAAGGLDRALMCGEIRMVFYVRSSPLNVHVRAELFYPPEGGFGREYKNMVNRLERREHLRALALRHNGAHRPFVGAHRRIGIDADHQQVAELFSRDKVAHVANVKKVKTAVRGDYCLAPPPGNVGRRQYPAKCFYFAHRQGQRGAL